MTRSSSAHRVWLSCLVMWSFSDAARLHAVEPAREKSAAVDGDAVAKIESVGGVVRQIKKGSDALEVDFQFGRATLTDDHLRLLAPLRQVHVLRLSNTRITDAGLAHVGKLTALKRLHLDRTAITDAGLKHLAGLTELESLNLFGTAVSDAGIGAIQALPKLKQVFIWQTKISADAVVRLRKAAPNLAVIPDPEAEREREGIVGEFSKSALADAEAALVRAKKEAQELAPQTAQLKQNLDAAKSLSDQAKAKTSDMRKQADQAAKDAESAAKRAAATPGDTALAAQAQEKNRLAVEARERADKARLQEEQARNAFNEAKVPFEKVSKFKQVIELAELAVAIARQQADDARTAIVPLSSAGAIVQPATKPAIH